MTSTMYLYNILFVVGVSAANIDPNILINIFGPEVFNKSSTESAQIAGSSITPSNTPMDDLSNWDSDDYTLSSTDFDMFDWIVTKRVALPSNKNCLISPVTLKLALGILTEAASDISKNELSSLLGLDLDRNLARNTFATIKDSLQKENPYYILKMGSRIYLESSAEPLRVFGSVAKNFYGTDVMIVTDNTALAVQDINGWASNITEVSIPNLVEEDDVASMEMLVLSTIYFKGCWRHQFASNATLPASFYVSPLAQIYVPFMHVKNKFYYTESTNLDAKILRLSYMGKHFAMYIIVPNSLTGLPHVLNRISYLRQELSSLKQRIVDVSLPKFQFNYKSQLDNTLRELGVQTVFDDTASFPGIVRKRKNQNLRISKVLQRSRIEVNEAGSKTCSVISPSNKFDKDSKAEVEVIANRPFLFYVQDEVTQQLLFTGKVTDPIQDDVQQIHYYTTTVTPPAVVTKAAKVTPPSYKPAVAKELTVDYCNYGAYRPPTADYDNFDWTLTQRVAESSDENFLITPLGLKLPLAYLMETATGQTQLELSLLLGLETDREVTRNKFSSSIITLQKKSPQFILNAGNRIYVDNSNLRARFVAIAELFYMTEIKTADFNNPLKEINGWVSNVTEGRLPNLADEVLVLIVNTLYFKGSWRHPFRAERTTRAPFYVSSSSQVNVPFMKVTAKFYYAEAPKFDAKILRMPYLGDEIAMYIVVPNTVFGLPLILNSLKELRIGMNYLQEQIVDVTLPKFKLGITSQLDGILKELGLRQVFEETASFPGIAKQQSSQRLRLSKVIQRTGMEVSEFGNVLCAESENLTNEEDIEWQDKIVANKPFLFFVQDEATRQLLLVGRVTNPSL